jgi:hypothetical protein
MSTLVICAVLISLSQFVTEEEEHTTSVPLPYYIPVLAAFIMPAYSAPISMLNKYAVNTRKFDVSDFSMSYIMGANLILFVCSMIYFHENGFQLTLYILGFIGGIFEAVGCTCLCNAYVRGPVGPCTALIYFSGPILVVLVAIKTLTLPNYLQLIALFFGVLGTLILTVPDELKNFGRKLIKCNFKNEA